MSKLLPLSSGHLPATSKHKMETSAWEHGRRLEPPSVTRLPADKASTTWRGNSCVDIGGRQASIVEQRDWVLEGNEATQAV